MRLRPWILSLSCVAPLLTACPSAPGGLAASGGASSGSSAGAGSSTMAGGGTAGGGEPAADGGAATGGGQSTGAAAAVGSGSAGAGSTGGGSTGGGSTGGGSAGGGMSSLFQVEAHLASEDIPVAPTTVGIVTWSTTAGTPTSATVEFGLTTDYGMEAPVDLSAPDLRPLLLGMKAEHTYHFRIVAVVEGESLVSEDFSLTTGGPPMKAW